MGLTCAEWRPVKSIIAEDEDFTILRSAPEGGLNGAVQFSIQRRNYGDDILRADSYRKGYFAAHWHSNIVVGEFLETVERFLSEFEPLPKPPPTINQPNNRYGALFMKSREWPQVYTFTRPLTEADIEAEGLLAKDHAPLALIRINTPHGDFCYQPQDKRVGIIATINPHNKERVIAATASFVTSTQDVLTPEIVVDTLNRLPYLKQSKRRLKARST